MAVDQLPGQVREFARYLNGLLTRLDQGGGWCAVFWQRDPDGMRACLDGWEVPPWDVVEALLQDLAAEYGPRAAAQEAERAHALHAASLAAYDARPGGRDALGDRLDVMLREQRYAAEREAELARLLQSAATQEEADTIRLDLAWAHDDHERATARCAELRRRMEDLDHRALRTPAQGAPHFPAGGAAGDVFRVDEREGAEGRRGSGSGGRQLSEGGDRQPSSGADRRVDAPQDWQPGGRDARRPDGQDAHGDRRPDVPEDWAPNARGARRPDESQDWQPSVQGDRRPDGPVANRGGHRSDAPQDWQAPVRDERQPDIPQEWRTPEPADRRPDAPAGPSAAPRVHPAAETPQAPEERPAPIPKQRSKRRPRGSARFAGVMDVQQEAPAAVAPPAASAPAPAAPRGRTPRGARFAGAAEPPEPQQPVREPLDDDARRETVEAVRTLTRLRAEGRSGEAHALLVEAAYWPAARFPLLAAELGRAGLGADWATLLWEAASLPADRLVAAADALIAAGRTADGHQVLRQGVGRPPAEIGEAVLGLVDEGRHREAGALLDAYVRIRTPEEVARSAEADPPRLVPLLLKAAQGASDERHWDLVHALRVAGFTA